jgi:o-succinylbenzoate---CoA ligase
MSSPMNHKTLTLNGREFSYQELKSGDFDTAGFSAFEKSTVDFCREWLNGQQSFIVHTSGSTGTPKPIHISREQMIASARMTGAALKLKSGDQALVCLNTAYIAGKMMLVRGFELDLGMTVSEPSSNPFDNSPAKTYDFMAVVPLQLQTILESGEEHLNLLNRMKAVIVGGAPVSYPLEQQLQNVHCAIYATYGMTETVSHIALKLLNTPYKEEFYQAFPEVKVSLDDRSCLCVESVLSGNQKLITNDIVRLIDFHKFEWIGRADHTINSGGVKIQTEQVEKAVAKALYEQGISCRFFVTALPDERLGQSVSLILENIQESNFPTERFKCSLDAYLSKYERPKTFHFTGPFCETESGKVQRHKTLKKYVLIP